MPQPVWALSVNLETKTATFQSGLADAAKNARGSFQDIKSGAKDMGAGVGYSTGEARHSVMMLGEEFGVHLPRSLTSFISGLGPIGPALEAAFPFLAIILGATLLIEHLAKLHESGEKLTEDQTNFGTAVQNAFNQLDEKILEAEIRADELKNNHLGALKLQLESIDKQSMDQLVHSFEEVAKAADVVMKDLEGHWYSFGIGSDGAKHALDQFKTQYDALLAQGKDKEASDLLAGTRQSAQATLAAMQGVKNNMPTASTGGAWKPDEKTLQYYRDANTLKAAGVGTTDKEIQAQQALVAALNAQEGMEQRIGELKKLEGQNVKTADAKTDGKYALDQLRKKQEEQIRLEHEFATNVKEANEDAVNATEEGSVARLAVLQKAMDETRALYGENSHEYKEFANEYIKIEDKMYKQLAEVAHAYDEEAAKQQADLAKEDASSAEKMGMLAVAAERQRIALVNSARRASEQQLITQETQFANEEYDIKKRALDKDIQGLNTSGSEYLVKLKALQDQEKQLTQAHEDELTAIREKAETETNNSLAASYQHFTSSISDELTKSIMGHQTWAKMIDSFGSEAASSMIKNSLMIMMQEDKERLSHARTAATAAYKTGESIGGPAGLVLGPVFAAAAFAGALAFEEGTDRVPGVGRGDIVPSMLSPGEGVVPGGVMDGLRNLVRDGGLKGGGTTYHVHGVHFAPTVHALDADGVDDVLTKHQDTFQKHFENTLRKMNR